MIQAIARIIFEALRLELVAANKLPDIVSVGSATAFQTALKAINNPILIYGRGNYDVKEKLKYDSVIISRIRSEQGQLNKGFQGYEYNETNGYFLKTIGQGIAVNLSIEVRLVWTFAENSELFDNLINKVFQKNYLDVSGQGKLNATIQSMTDLFLGTWTENIYTLKVSNVFLTQERLTSEITYPLLEFEPKTEIE